jgi:ribosomal protein S18 acetylase RimI-like enzyme
MLIRPMTQNDVNFAVKLAFEEKWYSENQDVFFAFLYHDPEGCFIAEEEGVPVAVCVATAYDRSGFFGELIVAESHRGRGIGTSLLNTALEYLKRKGVRSIYLDAAPKAVPIYERAGFRKVCASLRFTGKIEGQADLRVRSMRKWDLETVCSLDQDFFGANRYFFLKWICFIGPDFAKVLVHNDTIQGYITGRYTQTGISVGPWVMSPGIRNPESLLLSLAAEALSLPVSLGVLEINKKAVRLLRSMGMHERKISPVRMAMGDCSDLGTSPYCLAIGSPAKG